MKKSAFLSTVILLVFMGYFFNSCSTQEEQPVQALKLWFDRPAEYFEESLVLGNGKMGASVFGGVQSDKIYLNDATLWSGEPVDANMNPDAHKYIPKIREALVNENYKLADSLNRFVQGKFSESYAPLGTMFLEFAHEGEHKNYSRELDIESAVSQTCYEVNNVRFTREYFISNPDKVFIIKLSADQSEALNFSVKFNSLLKYTSYQEEEMLKTDGFAPWHAEPNYRGEIKDAVVFDENRGTRFSIRFKVKQNGGTVSCTDSVLRVNNANEAILYVSVATSFNGFDKNPATEGLDNKMLAFLQLKNAMEKDYRSIRDAHIEDFQKYMKRVSFSLGESTAPDLPTDERLKRYFHGEEDKYLEILYFQYGRYLLLSSSRTEGVPANLQGIWNPYMRPPWSSNYTMNINAQENYWMAETGNLSEMHRPFLGFLNNLSQTGEVTAKSFYGVNKGWTACHNSDIWAQSNPVGDFGQGHPVWACWNMSGAWSVTHLWEHFQFTQDMDFLRNEAYPLMKGAAEFCLGWLTEDEEGNLITSPSTSPENLYLTPEGYKGATLYGGTADLAMIRECLKGVIEASMLLDTDTEFRKELEATMTRLYPYQVGEKGNLQEWYHDWEDADPRHRHQSHLFGLHPGSHITPEQTPALAQACRRSLEIKGDESTGWSKGWRINLWARLKDGNHAYKMYRELLSYVDPSGLKTEYSQGGGTYPNLFDAHPPFQIDGNFGGTAGVIEMLLQSHTGSLQLLPALPDDWDSGKVSGLRARGGFELDISWKMGRLQIVTIKSIAGLNTLLEYKNRRYPLNLKKGESITLSLKDFQ